MEGALGTDAQPLNPRLGAGGYNEGITWSRPPVPGSPAIDSGGQCGSLDQKAVDPVVALRG